MEPSYPARGDSGPPGRQAPAGGRRAAAAAAAAVIVAVGLLVTPSARTAAPATRQATTLASAPGGSAAVGLVPADPQVDLDKLEARAYKLSKRYRGRLVKLDDAKSAAKKATKRLGKLNRRLDKVRYRVSRIAASQYMSGGLDPALTPLLAEDAEDVLHKAVLAEQMARSIRERVAELEALKKRQEQARRLAQQRIGEVRDEVRNLEKKQDKIEKLLDKFQPESPTTGDSITPRMQEVRDAVDRRFGPFVTIGCYRPYNDGGEHYLGRACDFMLSPGTVASGYDEQRGWDAANWARANASRLGIMYVIYRQQFWDARSGGGWEMMEDRGSVTQNHYDHVHISVL